MCRYNIHCFFKNTCNQNPDVIYCRLKTARNPTLCVNVSLKMGIGGLRETAIMAVLAEIRLPDHFLVH